MELTGIKWLDITIVVVLASGVLGMGWKWLASRTGVQKAMEKHKWLTTAEPIIGAAIAKAEAWGKENQKKGKDKLDHATEVAKKGMKAVGVPKKMLDNDMVASLIESKLTGGNFEDVAGGLLSKIATGRK